MMQADQAGADGGAPEMITPQTNADQEKFWDADAGPIWVRNAHAMDICLAPVLDLVLAKAALKQGEAVLDIGCGAGTSTFAAARTVGPSGSALGADISSTLLAYAKTRNEGAQAEFIYADAETYGFNPSSMDVMISRFGVMFFENATAAFCNMARAMRPGGRMVFAAWGAIPENPFFTLPAGVAKSFLGPIPKSDPDAPGPFSFRDAVKVCDMLGRSGWQDVKVEVEQILLTPAGGPHGFAELALQIGPAQSALAYHVATDAQHAELKTRIVEAAEIFVEDGQMSLPAEINLFSAQKA
jgi:SAM-dependent methyltransferase